MNIGFIGLGHMGTGMATNLVRAGHDVTVFNRTREKAEPLRTLGAKVVDHVADACRGAAVFTMLADDAALEGVVFAPDGVLARLASGAIHISSSTGSVELTVRLADAHHDAGQGSWPRPCSADPRPPPPGSCS